MATITKYASTATTITSTWGSSSNATGSTAGTYATWSITTANATGQLDLGGYDFATDIPSNATINSVTVTVRNFQSNVSRLLASQFQVMDGTTNIGALTTGTLTTSSTNEDVFTVSPTLTQLRSSTFKVRFTARRGSATQAATTNLDFISVTVDYSLPNTNGSASLSSTGTLTASGAVGPADGGSGGTGNITLQGTPTVAEINGTAASVAIPYPTGIVSGEVLVAQVTNSAATILTTSPGTGWVLAASKDNSAGTTPSTAIWYKIADGSETGSVTFTIASTTTQRLTGTMERWSGVDNTTPLDTAAVSNMSGVATTFTMPSITTITANAVLIHNIGLNASASADIDTLAGTTKITGSTGTGRRQGVFYETLATAGPSGTRTWTENPTTTALQWVGITIALRPAPGGTPVNYTGSASFSGTGTLSAVGNTAGSSNFNGSAALSGSGTLTASGTASTGGGSASITLQGTPSIYENATSLDAVIPYPSGIIAGELLLAHATFSTATANAAPSGWTTARVEAAGSNIDGAVYYRIADGSETGSVTFSSTGTAGRVTGFMERWSGVDNTTPFDVAVTGTSHTGTGTTVTAPSVTTVTGGAKIVYSVGVHASTSVELSSASNYNKIINSTGTGRKTSVFEFTKTTAGATGTELFSQVNGTGTPANLEMYAIVLPLRPASGGGTTPTPTLTQRIVGIPSTTSAIVSVKVSNATSVRLKVSTDAAGTTGVIYGSAATPSANGDAKLTVSGLTAGINYYYRVAMTNAGGEVLDTASTIGRLRAAPSGQTNFAFNFGSCTNATDSPSFAAIAAREDDLFFHLGDLYYADGSGTGLQNFRDKMNAKISATNHAAVFATTPMTYTPSDHDGMNNNGTAGSDPTAWANWNTAVSELFPMPSTYYSFMYGRVQFIQIDDRSFKSIPSATDNSSKTALGTTQKQWLKDQITASTAAAIVIIQPSPWIGTTTAGDDGWAGYNTERTELANFFSASGKNIVMLAGDMHALAADNGTNAPGGITLFHASPFAQNSSIKGGPYTAGPYPASGTSVVNQYGRCAITDTGSQISFAFVGYSSDNTSRVTTTKTFTVASNDFTGSANLSGSGTLSASGTVNTPVTANFTGSGTLTSARTLAVTASTNFTGSGTLTSTRTLAVSTSANFTGSGILSRTSTLTASVAAAFTGAGSLSVLGGTYPPSSAVIPNPERGNFFYSETHYQGTYGGSTTQTDAFTGTNGASPSAINWTVSNTTGSTTTIQSNTLRLVTGTTGGYNDSARLTSTLAAAVDADVTIDVTPTTSTEAYFDIMLRATGSNGSLGQAGYKFELTNTGSVSIQSITSYSGTFLANGTVSGFATNTQVHMQAKVVGSTLSLWAWTGSTKPSTPTLQVTDTTYTVAGNIGFYLNGGNVGAANTWNVDNWSATAGSTGTTPTGYVPLSGTAVASAVAAGQTQVFRYFYMEYFNATNSTISQAYLDLVAADLATARANGAKLIIRFAYSSSGSMTYPYDNPDPGVTTTVGHIQQLAPILNQYADVIEAIEAGLIGQWGEWYYTTNYAQSDPWVLSTQNQTDRNTVLTTLLSNLDSRIFVLVRYAGIKPNYFGQTTIPANTTLAGYWKRMGYHNDAQGASADDWGTYSTFPWAGWTNLPTDAKNFVQTDIETYPLPWGGEIASNNVTYAAFKTEMQRYRANFWNPSDFGGSQAAQGWTTANQTEIQTYLGYRLRLVSASLPSIGIASSSVSVTLIIANDGWATPLRNRPVIIDFVTGGTTVSSTLSSAQISTIQPGTQATISGNVILPSTGGTWNMYLRLPDPSTDLGNLQSNPAYSIQLANTGLWDSVTGRNNLNKSVTVQSAFNGSASLSGAGTLSVNTSTNISSSVNLTGSGTLSRTTNVATSSSAGLTGAGTLSSTNTGLAITGNGGLSGIGTLSATVSAVAVSRTVNLTGSGTLSLTSTNITASRTANLTGTGILSASSPNITSSGSGQLSGSGTLSTSGTGITTNSSAALTGSGALSSSASITQSISSSFTGTGTLTASGTAQITSFNGSANFSSSGALAAGGTANFGVTATFSGSGTLTRPGTFDIKQTGLLNGSGTLSVSNISNAQTATANFTGAGTLGTQTATAGTGVFNPSATGILSVTTSVTASAVSSFTGFGTLSVSPVITTTGTANLSSTGALTAPSSITASRTANLSGSGTLSSNNSPNLSGTTSNFSGSGSLSAPTNINIPKNVGLTGSGTLSSNSQVTTSRTANLSGTGTLSAVGVFNPTVTANFSGTGVLNTSVSNTQNTSAGLSGTGTLSAVASAITQSVSASFTGSGSLGSQTESAGTGFYNQTTSGILTVNASSTQNGTASNFGTGVLSVTGIAAFNSNVNFTSTGTLSRSTAFDISKTAAQTAIGSLSASGTVNTPVTANFTGSGILTKATSFDIKQNSGLSGSGTLSSSNSGLSVVTSIQFSATGTLNTQTAGSGSGSLNSSATGTLTAAGISAITGTAQFSGNGSLTGPAIITTSRSVNFTSSSTLTANTATSGASSANLSGTGTLSVTTVANIPVIANVSGTGTLSTSNRSITQQQSVNFTGSGTLTAGIVNTFVGNAFISGNGTLSASGVSNFSRTANFTSSGTLNTSSVFTISKTAALTATATLSATATVITQQATANFTSTGTLGSQTASAGTGVFSSNALGTLSAVARTSFSAAIEFTATSLLTTAVTIAPRVISNFSGTSTLVTFGISDITSVVNFTSSGTLAGTQTNISQENIANFFGSGTLSSTGSGNRYEYVQLSGSGILSVSTFVGRFSPVESITATMDSRQYNSVITTNQYYSVCTPSSYTAVINAPKRLS